MKGHSFAVCCGNTRAVQTSLRVVSQTMFRLRLDARIACARSYFNARNHLMSTYPMPIPSFLSPVSHAQSSTTVVVCLNGLPDTLYTSEEWPTLCFVVQFHVVNGDLNLRCIPLMISFSLVSSWRIAFMFCNPTMWSGFFGNSSLWWEVEQKGASLQALH